MALSGYKRASSPLHQSEGRNPKWECGAQTATHKCGETLNTQGRKVFAACPTVCLIALLDCTLAKFARVLCAVGNTENQRPFASCLLLRRENLYVVFGLTTTKLMPGKGNPIAEDKIPRYGVIKKRQGNHSPRPGQSCFFAIYSSQVYCLTHNI